MITIDKLKNIIGGRDVYIWGTRIAGLSAAKILPTYGINIKAFIDNIDNIQSKLGLNILLPKELLNIQNKFIIICTRGHSPHVINTCIENNMTEKDFITWEELQQFDYYIEINNRCNLNCMTCSQKKYNNIKPLLNMSISNFKEMLEKIRKEDPFTSWLNLFGYNEAFLNNDLSEMIKISNSLNFTVGLSTNLAFNINFEDVIKAKPLWIRVSISGYDKNYELIHQGGKFDTVLKNLKLLSEYRNKHSKDTTIEILFHKYKHNLNDIPKIKKLCNDLGFEFRCIYASILGLETVSDILDKKPLSLKTQTALQYLCHSIEDTAKQSLKQKHFPCSYDHIIRIRSDLTIVDCQCWSGSTITGLKFTDNISFEELQNKLTNTKYCNTCKPKGLHQFYEIVFNEENEKLSNL
jgi:MoaA/NifB/PqqE/SkfB family radical SAM enzyme